MEEETTQPVQMIHIQSETYKTDLGSPYFHKPVVQDKIKF